MSAFKWYWSGDNYRNPSTPLHAPSNTHPKLSHLEKDRRFAMDNFENAAHIDELKHECENFLRLCIRSIGKTGGTAYVHQCLFCGAQKGNAISKSSIPKPENYFDAGLEDRYWEKRQQLVNNALEPGSSGNQYIHPLPYDSFEEQFDHFITDLQKRDGVQEQMIHGYLSRYIMQHRERSRELFTSQFSNEIELQQWLQQELSRWFYVYPEVSGVGFINRKKYNVRIDFVIKAKPTLLEKGFTDKAIGIEVKHLNPRTIEGFHKKSSRGVFQALSYWYSGARWNLESSLETELAAVLIFSDLSFMPSRERLFNSIDEHYRKYWNAYFSIANHGNIGELIFDGEPNTFYKWRMNFAHATYFSGYRNGDLLMGNPNLINKSRIGSTNA